MTTASTTLNDDEESQSLIEEEVRAYTVPIILSAWISFFILGTFINFGSLFFLWWFRDEPIVAMGQPRLLSVMCVGALFLLVGSMLHQSTRSVVLGETVFFIADDWNFNIPCHLSQWFMSLGYFTMELIVFLKLYRVYKVMQVRRNQQFLPRHIIAPFGVGLMAPMLINALRTIFKPGMDSFGGVPFCFGFDKYYWVQFGFFYLLRISLLVFAWRLRNIKESIGDTGRIFRWVIFSIITHIWEPIFNNGIAPNLSYMSSHTAWRVCLIVFYIPMFLDSIAPAIFLVFPRMYLLWYKRVHGHLPDRVHMYGTGQVHVRGDNTNTRTDSAEVTQEREAVDEGAGNMGADEGRNDDENGNENENENKVDAESGDDTNEK